MPAVAQPSSPGPPKPVQPLKAGAGCCHPTHMDPPDPNCSSHSCDKGLITPVCPCGPDGRMPRESLTLWRGCPRVRTRPRISQSPADRWAGPLQPPEKQLHGERQQCPGSWWALREGQCPQTQQREKASSRPVPHTECTQVTGFAVPAWVTTAD